MSSPRSHLFPYPCALEGRSLSWEPRAMRIPPQDESTLPAVDSVFTLADPRSALECAELPQSDM